MRVLVVNAGSSSLKLSLLDSGAEGGKVLADGSDLRQALADWGRPDAVGHRVVHGGSEFAGPTRIAGDVRQRIEALTELAPLHQPLALAGIDEVARRLPDVPSVACFDTAFHANIPAAASTYALPAEWRSRHPVRRFGFHGLSHAYAARMAAERTGARRIVSCHLGAGASVAAVRDGGSVDTTMGFTPLEGLVMATRSGSVDPGLLLWLQARDHISAADMLDALEHRSGLLGLAGTADMRVVLQRADADAVLAVAVYVHRLVAAIAAMAAAMGGLEALVFTGGVGERAAAVRAAAAGRLAFLGVGLDAAANDAATGDADISAADAPVRVLVVTAREDLEIARQVVGILAG